MTHRSPLRLVSVCALALAGAALIACSPEPTPTPSPTPAFASEEEAFAAAEETYRAYIAALNEVDLTDPKTFEPVFEHTAGEFEAGDRENLTTLRAEGLTLSGENVMTGFVPIETSRPFSTVLARICVDVSDVAIVDEAGDSQIPPDRPPNYAVDVEFALHDRTFLIHSARRSEKSTCD